MSLSAFRSGIRVMSSCRSSTPHMYFKPYITVKLIDKCDSDHVLLSDQFVAELCYAVY